MKLIKKEDGIWMVQADFETVEGSLHYVKDYLVESKEIEAEEVDAAVATMQMRGDDTAHFGILRGIFTHTSQSQTTRLIVAELKAIRSMREEFHQAHRRDPDGADTRSAFDRLMNLYMSLNVDGILKALIGRSQV
jgi:hypothetical protein